MFPFQLWLLPLFNGLSVPCMWQWRTAHPSFPVPPPPPRPRIPSQGPLSQVPATWCCMVTMDREPLGTSVVTAWCSLQQCWIFTFRAGRKWLFKDIQCSLPGAKALGSLDSPSGKNQIFSLQNENQFCTAKHGFSFFLFFFFWITKTKVSKDCSSKLVVS